MRLLCIIFLWLLPVLAIGQHPVTFFTAKEAGEIKKGVGKYPLLTRSYMDLKKNVDQYLGKDVDVPFPKDPAGGYTHDRHKANYMLMFNSGVLYHLTGDARYAKLVRDLLLKYAVLNPTLKKHPQATSSSPGHIFWQALNDANWLVYAGMAYDLICNTLPEAEKKKITEGAFRPEVDFFTKDLKSWFNLIHNHGVWACAGVGIVGIATGNKHYVEMALYGTERNGKSGFIAQMDGLFSPDGYYTEGPYYVRYAILPYYLFANALNHARPGLKIFEHRNRILQKALLAGLQQTNLDGRFFPLNDALKDKDYTCNELVTAIDIACDVYGMDDGLLYVAKKQDRVLLHKGGAAIASALAGGRKVPSAYPYRSVEYADGVNGDEGGVSFLRAGKNDDLSTLIFKYTAHGLSHGHFDKLNINFFDRGNEILTDYGSVRFIGVEQKFGGRYLPENKTYSSQTIAHNTIVIDESSHFNGNEDLGEKYHSDKLFSDITRSSVQYVAARESNAYENTRLQRAVYMIQLPGAHRMVVDLYDAIAASDVQFDLPFQYQGQLISTSFPYTAFVAAREPLGKKNGYQFIWKEAAAKVRDTVAQLTFLNGSSFYTISSLVEGDAELFLTRTGAGDPNFNLRQEPAFVIRKKGRSGSFASVIEVHGKYDPVAEFSIDAYSSVKAMKMLSKGDYTVVEITINDGKLVIAQSNTDFDKMKTHNAAGVQWTGPFAAWYNGKILN